MASLAAALFDTARNLSNKASAKTMETLRMRSFFEATSGRGIDDPTRAFLAANIESFYRDVPDLIPALRQSMKFSINDNVADSLQKMDKTPSETLIKAYRYAKLPYKKTWIEYETKGNAHRFGWLMEDTPNGISLKHVHSNVGMNHIPMYKKPLHHFLINENGFSFASPPQATPEIMAQHEKTKNFGAVPDNQPI
jgi:hypothetical protein